MDLETPLAKADRVYKMYANRLSKLGIFKLEDFLYHIPFRYDDYSLVSKINKVQPGETITVKGEVLEIKNQYARSHKTFQRARIEDDTGIIDIIWFNQPFLLNVIKKGDLVSLSGKIKKNLNKLTLESPDYEVIYGDGENIHTGRLVPVYPETRGVSSKWLRRQVYKILKNNDDKIDEFLPNFLIKNENLISLKDALWQIHFPRKIDEVEVAKNRLAFDELLLMQIEGLINKEKWNKLKSGQKLEIKKYEQKLEDYIQDLPFELTNAQKKATKEILSDLSLEKPMNRLLEGDVGSGKTVVGSIAIYLAFLNGLQSVLMAPTEILAQQHFKTLQNFLSPYGVRVSLATGSEKIKKGEKFDVLVGTHAVISPKINFKNLGLVIIDEQQRFGVEQRTIVRQKGENPHFLTMTATPIPRTVALTMYGDLDLSYLNEMPIGRKKVKTWMISEEKREGAYKWINNQIIKNKDQAFIVCPFIEESETMTTVKAATKEFDKLKKDVFPKLKVLLLHGKMKSKDKESVLKKFKEGKCDVLIATPVVEVGIDIPNATIILIETAERFGLAELHQLRGRVGRGEKQSYCLLFTESKNQKTLERLKALEQVYIGAELAEYDLKLRGPGQIYGTLQHGIPALKIANFSDFPLIKKTKVEAEKIYKKIGDYPKLVKKIKGFESHNVSPD